MKVFNLRCRHDHRFEGWFGSETDYADQVERGLVECPVCSDKTIERLPSAPRLNVAHLQSRPPEPAPEAQRQSAWMRQLRELVARTEDVGERFAEEARRIHYGEVEERGIRGRASAEDARALADEGIEVLALPALPGLKEPLQ